MGCYGIVTVFLKVRGYALLIDKYTGSDFETGSEFGSSRQHDANWSPMCVGVHGGQRRSEKVVRRGIEISWSRGVRQRGGRVEASAPVYWRVMDLGVSPETGGVIPWGFVIP